MHRLLKRQIRRTIGAVDGEQPDLEALLTAVDEAYAQYDEDRAMLERSLELSSQELLQSNGELNAIFRALPDLFIRIDGEGRVVDARGSGSDDEQLLQSPGVGTGLDELLVPEAAAAIRDALPQVADELSGTTINYVVRSRGGEHFYEARLLPVPPHDVMIVIRDVTDRVQAAQAEAAHREQEARARAMEEFAYVASHDLRAPLRAIGQLAGWLHDDLDEQIDEESRERLGLLRSRVRRMDQLLVGLLDYSRAGTVNVPLEDVDVGELVLGVVDLVDSPGFEVRVGAMPSLVTARGPLERVFLNLIVNAIKHHDQGKGVIEVSSEDAGDRFLFSVSDDGPGIPERDRERVFEMFRTLRRRDDTESTGMGLALIRRIVEQAGGEVKVTSAPVRGATFTFGWPKAWAGRHLSAKTGSA